MTDRKRVPPPDARPDPIVIRVRKGKAKAVYEIPGKHFDAPLTSVLGKGLTVGYFHGMIVTLPELPQ
jgi:hypothetical protein